MKKVLSTIFTLIATSSFAEPRVGLTFGINDLVYSYYGWEYGETNQSPIGVFFGYDHSFGRVFVGGEVAATIGTERWEYYTHDETGNGTPVAIDMKLRAGYKHNGFSVYGFGGITKYSNVEWSHGSYFSSGEGSIYGVGLEKTFGNFLVGVEYSQRILELDYNKPYISGEDLKGEEVTVRIGWSF